MQGFQADTRVSKKQTVVVLQVDIYEQGTSFPRWNVDCHRALLKLKTSPASYRNLASTFDTLTIAFKVKYVSEFFSRTDPRLHTWCFRKKEVCLYVASYSSQCIGEPVVDPVLKDLSGVRKTFLTVIDMRTLKRCRIGAKKCQCGREGGEERRGWTGPGRVLWAGSSDLGLEDQRWRQRTERCMWNCGALRGRNISGTPSVSGCLWRVDEGGEWQ